MLWGLIGWIVFFAFLIRADRQMKAKKRKEYEESTYYKITHLPLDEVKGDRGRWGEYLIYKKLKWYENYGAKFLFNIYVPKGENETSEIDVLMINNCGLFVFESKRYGGWIFGKENQKMWCETFPTGRGSSHREYFYNPILQNRSHIKYLKEYLNNDVPTNSIIVFSGKCELRDVETYSGTVNVIYLDEIEETVSRLSEESKCVLSNLEIASIYNALYPLTQVDDRTKAHHIANIENFKN